MEYMFVNVPVQNQLIVRREHGINASACGTVYERECYPLCGLDAADKANRQMCNLYG